MSGTRVQVFQISKAQGFSPTDWQVSKWSDGSFCRNPRSGTTEEASQVRSLQHSFAVGVKSVPFSQAQFLAAVRTSALSPGIAISPALANLIGMRDRDAGARRLYFILPQQIRGIRPGEQSGKHRLGRINIRASNRRRPSPVPGYLGATSDGSEQPGQNPAIVRNPTGGASVSGLR